MAYSPVNKPLSCLFTGTSYRNLGPSYRGAGFPGGMDPAYIETEIPAHLYFLQREESGHTLDKGTVPRHAQLLLQHCCA